MAVALQVVYTYAQGLQWCAQVADGLAFLHAQSPRIIHRDVKLDNVLLSDGASDFGMSRLHRVPTILLLNSQTFSAQICLWHLLAALTSSRQLCGGEPRLLHQWWKPSLDHPPPCTAEIQMRVTPLILLQMATAAWRRSWQTLGCTQRSRRLTTAPCPSACESHCAWGGSHILPHSTVIRTATARLTHAACLWRLSAGCLAAVVPAAL